MAASSTAKSAPSEQTRRNQQNQVNAEESTQAVPKTRITADAQQQLQQQKQQDLVRTTSINAGNGDDETSTSNHQDWSTASFHSMSNNNNNNNMEDDEGTAATTHPHPLRVMPATAATATASTPSTSTSSNVMLRGLSGAPPPNNQAASLSSPSSSVVAAAAAAAAAAQEQEQAQEVPVVPVEEAGQIQKTVEPPDPSAAEPATTSMSNNGAEHQYQQQQQQQQELTHHSAGSTSSDSGSEQPVIPPIASASADTQQEQQQHQMHSLGQEQLSHVGINTTAKNQQQRPLPESSNSLAARGKPQQTVQKQQKQQNQQQGNLTVKTSTSMSNIPNQLPSNKQTSVTIPINTTTSNNRTMSLATPVPPTALTPSIPSSSSEQPQQQQQQQHEQSKPTYIITQGPLLHVNAVKSISSTSLGGLSKPKSRSSLTSNMSSNSHSSFITTTTSTKSFSMLVRPTSLDHVEILRAVLGRLERERAGGKSGGGGMGMGRYVGIDDGSDANGRLAREREVEAFGNLMFATLADHALLIVGTKSRSYIHFSTVETIRDENELGTPESHQEYRFACETSPDYQRWIQLVVEAFDELHCEDPNYYRGSMSGSSIKSLSRSRSRSRSVSIVERQRRSSSGDRDRVRGNSNPRRPSEIGIKKQRNVYVDGDGDSDGYDSGSLPRGRSRDRRDYEDGRGSWKRYEYDEFDDDYYDVDVDVGRVGRGRKSGNQIGNDGQPLKSSLSRKGSGVNVKEEMKKNRDEIDLDDVFALTRTAYEFGLFEGGFAGDGSGGDAGQTSQVGNGGDDEERGRHGKDVRNDDTFVSGNSINSVDKITSRTNNNNKSNRTLSSNDTANMGTTTTSSTKPTGGGGAASRSGSLVRFSKYEESIEIVPGTPVLRAREVAVKRSSINSTSGTASVGYDREREVDRENDRIGEVGRRGGGRGYDDGLGDGGEGREGRRGRKGRDRDVGNDGNVNVGRRRNETSVVRGAGGASLRESSVTRSREWQSTASTVIKSPKIDPGQGRDVGIAMSREAGLASSGDIVENTNAKAGVGDGISSSHQIYRIDQLRERSYNIGNDSAVIGGNSSVPNSPPPLSFISSPPPGSFATSVGSPPLAPLSPRSPDWMDSPTFTTPSEYIYAISHPAAMTAPGGSGSRALGPNSSSSRETPPVGVTSPTRTTGSNRFSFLKLLSPKSSVKANLSVEKNEKDKGGDGNGDFERGRDRHRNRDRDGGRRVGAGNNGGSGRVGGLRSMASASSLLSPKRGGERNVERVVDDGGRRSRSWSRGDGGGYEDDYDGEMRRERGRDPTRIRSRSRDSSTSSNSLRKSFLASFMLVPAVRVPRSISLASMLRRTVVEEDVEVDNPSGGTGGESQRESRRVGERSVGFGGNVSGGGNSDRSSDVVGVGIGGKRMVAEPLSIGRGSVSPTESNDGSESSSLPRNGNGKKTKKGASLPQIRTASLTKEEEVGVGDVGGTVTMPASVTSPSNGSTGNVGAGQASVGTLAYGGGQGSMPTSGAVSPASGTNMNVAPPKFSLPPPPSPVILANQIGNVRIQQQQQPQQQKQQQQLPEQKQTQVSAVSGGKEEVTVKPVEQSPMPVAEVAPAAEAPTLSSTSYTSRPISAVIEENEQDVRDREMKAQVQLIRQRQRQHLFAAPVHATSKSAHSYSGRSTPPPALSASSKSRSLAQSETEEETTCDDEDADSDSSVDDERSGVFGNVGGVSGRGLVMAAYGQAGVSYPGLGVGGGGNRGPQMQMQMQGRNGGVGNVNVQGNALISPPATGQSSPTSGLPKQANGISQPSDTTTTISTSVNSFGNEASKPSPTTTTATASNISTGTVKSLEECRLVDALTPNTSPASSPDREAERLAALAANAATPKQQSKAAMAQQTPTPLQRQKQLPSVPQDQQPALQQQPEVNQNVMMGKGIPSQIAPSPLRNVVKAVPPGSVVDAAVNPPSATTTTTTTTTSPSVPSTTTESAPTSPVMTRIESGQSADADAPPSERSWSESDGEGGLLRGRRSPRLDDYGGTRAASPSPSRGGLRPGRSRQNGNLDVKVGATGAMGSTGSVVGGGGNSQIPVPVAGGGSTGLERGRVPVGGGANAGRTRTASFDPSTRAKTQSHGQLSKSGDNPIKGVNSAVSTGNVKPNVGNSFKERVGEVARGFRMKTGGMAAKEKDEKNGAPLTKSVARPGVGVGSNATQSPIPARQGVDGKGNGDDHEKLNNGDNNADVSAPRPSVSSEWSLGTAPRPSYSSSVVDVDGGVSGRPGSFDLQGVGGVAGGNGNEGGFKYETYGGNTPRPSMSVDGAGAGGNAGVELNVGFGGFAGGNGKNKSGWMGKEKSRRA
ncbi:hypothetical protein HDU76_004479 [Blyttiomyces sp. JEL0837]|nr:hypothetical protein HDU76_004479 [Blyttiomyces sp. JEL0837]